MKLLTQKLKLRLIRLSRYSLLKKKKRWHRRYVEGKWRYARPGAVIKAPERFNLRLGAAVEVVRFLKAVAYTVLVLKKPVRLNFKATKSFHVPGTILLFSELDRIITLSDLPKPISIIEPMFRKPREVLKQIGLYGMTGDHSDVIPTKDDVIFWKATKGANQTGDDLGPLIEFVAERANKEHTRQVEVSRIWRGVSEAVANTVDHAYAHPRSDGFAGLDTTKWWMFTQIRENRFTAAVCDLGCGYRSTINHTISEQFRSKIQQIFQGVNPDAVAILTAMEYGRSGTRETNRGKGSRDALSVLTTYGQGELTILSNTAWVQCTLGRGGNEHISRGDLGVDIQGTIIWWHLPLQDNGYDDD